MGKQLGLTVIFSILSVAVPSLANDCKSLLAIPSLDPYETLPAAPSTRDFLNSFSSEIAQLKKQGLLRLSDINDSTLMRLKGAESEIEFYSLLVNETFYYFTNKPGQLEAQNRLRWGKLRLAGPGTLNGIQESRFNTHNGDSVRLISDGRSTILDGQDFGNKAISNLYTNQIIPSTKLEFFNLYRQELQQLVNSVKRGHDKTSVFSVSEILTATPVKAYIATAPDTKFDALLIDGALIYFSKDPQSLHFANNGNSWGFVDPKTTGLLPSAPTTVYFDNGYMAVLGKDGLFSAYSQDEKGSNAVNSFLDQERAEEPLTKVNPVVQAIQTALFEQESDTLPAPEPALYRIFLTVFKDELQQIVDTTPFTLSGLLQGEVYPARLEQVGTDGNNLFVLTTETDLFYFSKNPATQRRLGAAGKAWGVLNQDRSGLLGSGDLTLILDDSLWAQIDPKGNVQVFPLAHKSLEPFANSPAWRQVSQWTKDFIGEYKQELEQALKQTDLTTEILHNAMITPASFGPNHESVYLIETPTRTLYFSQRKGALEPQRPLRWGTLQQQKPNFQTMLTSKLTLGDGSKIQVDRNGRIARAPTFSKSEWEEAIGAMENPNLAFSFVQQALTHQFHEQIEQLLRDQKISLRALLEGHVQYAQSVKTGDHIFILSGIETDFFFVSNIHGDHGSSQWGELSQIDTAVYGQTFLTDNGLGIQVKPSIGFISGPTRNNYLLDDNEMDRLILAKSEFVLPGNEPLSEDQKTWLIEAFQQMTDKSVEQILAGQPVQKHKLKDIIDSLGGDSAFTADELEILNEEVFDVGAAPRELHSTTVVGPLSSGPELEIDDDYEDYDEH